MCGIKHCDGPYKKPLNAPSIEGEIEWLGVDIAKEGSDRTVIFEKDKDGNITLMEKPID